MPVETVSSKKAAELLCVKEATLYAYVSRGMIRSVEPGAGDDPRVRHYVAADIYALLQKKSVRRDPARAAEGALNWGTPVLESALTRIENGRLFYRGQDAAELARTATFEAVAGLLWRSEPDHAPLPFTDSGASARRDTPAGQFIVPTLAALQSRVTLAGADDLRAYDIAPEGVAATGWRIIRQIARALTPDSSASRVAGALAAHYGASERLFEAALILCADHELNASSFTARVVASTGANPYAVVGAALAALSGPLHGGAVLRAYALIQETSAQGQPERALLARVQRGESISGFGHRLYPDGDPRYSVLSAFLEEEFAAAATFQFCRALAAAGQKVTGHSPNIDFALASLVYVLGQPPELTTGFFALGRTAGWIAHAIEQYADGRLIRPRARYTGD